MNNLVTLKDASRISGKSERTIRRWIGRGVLTDQRTTKGRRVPIVLDVTQLRAHLATLSPTPDQVADNGTNGNGTVADSAGQLAAVLTAQVEDLRQDKERLLRRVEALEVELAEAREARTALERELNGRRGVKGLLRAMWR